jgi:hypothetical protein
LASVQDRTLKVLKPKQHQPWPNTNRLPAKIHSSISFSTTAFRTPSLVSPKSS